MTRVKAPQRYRELVEKAEGLNHRLALVVYVGDPEIGADLVHVPLDAEWAGPDLRAAMDKIEAYLDSPVATRRAALVDVQRGSKERYLRHTQLANNAADRYDEVSNTLGEETRADVAAAQSRRLATDDEINDFVKKMAGAPGGTSQTPGPRRDWKDRDDLPGWKDRNDLPEGRKADAGEPV